MIEKISRSMARAVLIAAQGLDRLPTRPATQTDVLAVIRRMNLLQIDTIHVVARSPYLVLWSRLGDYQPAWLDELLAERAIFETWGHAYCFAPLEDYSLYRRRALDLLESQGWPYGWAARFPHEHPEVYQRVLAHLHQNGAVRSAEFENKSPVPGGWWNWKEEKDALEAMLLRGEVMVARRQNFQRVYDLRRRVLPEWDDASVPSAAQVNRALILRAVAALGVAVPAWVPDYFRLPKQGIAKQLQALAHEGLLHLVEVDGLPGPAYVHPDHLPLLEAAATDELRSEQTTLLSPFDPLVWDRARALALFDFDYKIECYTPAARRRYGYFTLPILHQDRLVGRLDPKAHRAQGLFEVKALHLEPGVHIDDALVAGLAAALRRLAAWHATPEVMIRRSNPTELAGLLQAAL